MKLQEWGEKCFLAKSGFMCSGSRTFLIIHYWPRPITMSSQQGSVIQNFSPVTAKLTLCGLLTSLNPLLKTFSRRIQRNKSSFKKRHPKYQNEKPTTKENL